MNVLGVIPARGGSRAIPRKNLALLCGRPLLAYTADAVSGSHALTRSIVSTDDNEIAAVSRTLGLQVPFMRPAAISTDHTPMIDVLHHALDWLETNENYSPDVVALLQPTSPLRKGQDIDGAVRLLVESAADTVVSVVEVPHQFTPESLMTMEDGKLKSFTSGDPVLRRQDKKSLYARNGPAVLVMRSAVVKEGRLYGETTLPYVMSRADSVDIDGPEDLVLAEFLLGKQ